jgi:phosphohistidine phosphatase SixA
LLVAGGVSPQLPGWLFVDELRATTVAGWKERARMTLYIVRHAVAVPRRHWDGDDDVRPLTSTGRVQVKRLLKWSHHHLDATRVLTSPTTRCVDTVRRIALALDVTLEPVEELRLTHEHDAVALVRELIEQPDEVVLCTHGEIVKPVLAALRPKVRGGDLHACAKGSVWALQRGRTGLTGRYTLNRQLPTTRP